MAIKEIKARELCHLLDDNKEKLEIIDVRSPDEYEIIHIKGSKLIPLDEISVRMDEIDWEKKVVFICRSGARSLIAARMASKEKSGEAYNLGSGILGCYSLGKNKNLEVCDNEDLVKKYFS
ncbi:MAG: rhodanese-like domain-containing protein [Patescibacteria group bacterium]|jgi:rhodanese-related sulfurtransferase